MLCSTFSQNSLKPLIFMCFDHHVKYWIPHGFPITSSLLLDYRVKQHIRTLTFKKKLNSIIANFIFINMNNIFLICLTDVKGV